MFKSKFLLLALVLFEFMLARAAHANLDDNATKLLALGFTQVDSGEYFYRGPTLIRLNAATSALELNQKFSGVDWVEDIQTIWVQSLPPISSATLCLSGQSLAAHQSRFSCATLNGSGQSGQGDGAPPADRAGKTMVEQLAMAGFVPMVGSPHVFTLRFAEVEVVAILDQHGKIVSLTAPASEEVRAMVAQAAVVDYKTTPGRYSFEGPVDSLVFASPYLEFAIQFQYGASLDGSSSRYLRELNEIPLSFLRASAPKAFTDSAGFNVGGANSSASIRKLGSINGVGIADIEKSARTLPGCSDGEPSLLSTESLVDILARDNDTVKASSLDHQAVALPLLYIRAIDAGNFPTEFSWKGQKFSVDFGLTPMCGALESPFGDSEYTSITFPKITKVSTGEVLEVSMIQGYLIHQYGFYGGNLPHRHAGPEQIAKFFGP